MRVNVPDDQKAGAVLYVVENYAKDIGAAVLQFSKVTYQHTRMSLREFEAGRARTAEINGCVACQNFRVDRDVADYLTYVGGDAQQSVMTHGPVPDEAFYANVSHWRTSPIYDEREKLIIEFTERMGLDPQMLPYDDEFWSRMKARFDDDEIADLTFCTGSWIAVGRIAHALGLDGVCEVGLPAKSETIPA